MKKKINLMLNVFCLLGAVLYCGAGCTGQNKKECSPENGVVKATERVRNGKEMLPAPDFSGLGRSPYTAAIYCYLADSLRGHYEASDVCLPAVIEVAADERDSNDILFWGDFWVFNYNLHGDTLHTTSGGNYPGLMHLRKKGNVYEVYKFEALSDGSGFVPSAKRIFGDKYNVFCKLSSDGKEREKMRKTVIAHYARKSGVRISCYKDYGWEAVKVE